MSKKNKTNQIQQVNPSKEANSENDDKVIFHALNVGALKIPPLLLDKYEEYVNVLWKTNVLFGFGDLAEEEMAVLEKIEFEIVFFQEDGLTPHLLFIIDKNFHIKDLKKIVLEKGDIKFAERIMNCMYSDLGILPSDG